ncbi:hypothetical protein [Microlunatus sp. Y2014]|uniref:hypothetical protein n=1 Tax=Microlunatus sp. Y2014 TaxID=3418488 RepID=UPI003DA70EFF
MSTRTSAPPGAAWWACLLPSLYAAIVAVVWIAVPGSYPYGHDDIITVGFNHLIEREVGIAIALTAAAVGLVTVGIGIAGSSRGQPTRGSRTTLRMAGAVAVAEALCFTFVLGDGAILPMIGYLGALGVPVALVAVLVLVGRHRPRVGVALLVGAAALVAVGLVSGALPALGRAAVAYLTYLIPSFAHFGPRVLATVGWLAGAAGWSIAAICAFRAARSDAPADGATGWTRPAAVRRWGRVATIAAALGPVPYGLVRLTWVTPWPLGGLGLDEFVISRELSLTGRLQGFLFVPAVAVGVVLTLGLISRWGEVFPRWLPVVGGRTVPVNLAVVPGILVAAVITLSAPGFLLGPVLAGNPLEIAFTLFFFPFPIWGPALGAAVFAYWLRRTRGADVTAAPARAAIEVA